MRLTHTATAVSLEATETPIGQKINLRYTLFKQMIAQRMEKRRQDAEYRKQQKELEKFEQE